MSTLHNVVVKRGRAKPLWRLHPWVFRDSIAHVDGNPQSGDLVEVQDDARRTIGWGFFSPESKIAVRIFEREDPTCVETSLIRDRITAAAELRTETLGLPVVTDAYRVVHAEGDGLPGLVVDSFAGHLVVQFSTAGMSRRREQILDILEEVLEPSSIHEVVDKRALTEEGLKIEPGLRRGALPPKPPSVLEHGICFRIGLGTGQKTGFYADQRDNRQTIGRMVRDRTVLDLHTYTGGFGLHAAANGAWDVLGVDSSGPALALAVENAMLNHGRQVRFQRGDARKVLDDLKREGRKFDIVICDPPRLAPNRAAVPRALKVYRDLHLRAMRVVEPGGLLAMSCCSGAVTPMQFEATIREAAFDVKREVAILQRGGQSPDHPVRASCPESRYLKFVLACVA